MTNTKFYNDIAEQYDEMIPLEKQIQNKIDFIRTLSLESGKTAADIGAGSGADSIALAKSGLNVTAFEPSSQMLEQAKENFKKHNVKVEIYNRKVVEIDKSFFNSFDYIFSLGNTFANISQDEIEESINQILKLLKPNGKAVLQILNYTSVLEQKERIVNITESDNKQFIRFYDFCNEKVFFNVLSFDKKNSSDKKLFTTEIFPYTKDFLDDLLTEIGITKTKYYGNVNLDKFDYDKSPNLIIVISK